MACTLSNQFRYRWLPFGAPTRRWRNPSAITRAFAANCQAQPAILDQRIQNIAQFIHIAGLKEHAVFAVTNQFEISAHPRSHRTTAAGHGFQQRIGQAPPIATAARKYQSPCRHSAAFAVAGSENADRPIKALAVACERRCSCMEPLPTIDNLSPGRRMRANASIKVPKSFSGRNAHTMPITNSPAERWDRPKHLQIHAVIAEPESFRACTPSSISRCRRTNSQFTTIAFAIRSVIRMRRRYFARDQFAVRTLARHQHSVRPPARGRSRKKRERIVEGVDQPDAMPPDIGSQMRASERARKDRNESTGK